MTDLPREVTASPTIEDQEAAMKKETPAPAQEPGAKNTVTLTKPLEINGQSLSVLTVDPDKLTGASATRAERLFAIACPDWPEDKNIFASMTYWMILGSIAAGIPYSAVETMPMLDSLALGGTARSAFFGM